MAAYDRKLFALRAFARGSKEKAIPACHEQSVVSLIVDRRRARESGCSFCDRAAVTDLRQRISQLGQIASWEPFLEGLTRRNFLQVGYQINGFLADILGIELAAFDHDCATLTFQTFRRSKLHE
jgi:hypothetical protein